ncbi:hypothetical protein [Georgenia sp. AZ-5]|uniref:hypothetical protein n=1 Tax=Georgenia sp. AZ-5 TaxID=3367526 RepID=UPI00375407F6
MRYRGVEGVILTGPALAGLKRGDLDWLADLDGLKAVELNYERVPPIPPEVLPRLESFQRIGRSSQVISTDQLPNVRGLTISPVAGLDGGLDACPHLVSVALAGFDHPDLRILDGCTNLKQAKIQAKRNAGPISFGWEHPPERLEYLQLIGLPITGLHGIDQLPHLWGLHVDLTRVPEHPPRVDLTPLRGCRKLAGLTLGMAGHLTHLEVLAELPELDSTVVVEGMHDPSTVDVPGLRVIRLTPRQARNATTD